MRLLAGLYLLIFATIATLVGYAMAQGAAVSQGDLLDLVLNPQTGAITILLVLVVVGWRFLLKVLTRLDEVQSERLAEKDATSIMLKEQREYFVSHAEKRHEMELALHALMERNTLTLSRVEQRLEK